MISVAVDCGSVYDVGVSIAELYGCTEYRRKISRCKDETMDETGIEKKSDWHAISSEPVPEGVPELVK